MLSDIQDALAKVQSQVDSASAANTKAGEKQFDDRNSAIKAAEKAGLTVDTASLPAINAIYAETRFNTLVALLKDCQSQLTEIETLTA